MIAPTRANTDWPHGAPKHAKTAKNDKRTDPLIEQLCSIKNEASVPDGNIMHCTALVSIKTNETCVCHKHFYSIKAENMFSCFLHTTCFHIKAINAKVDH